MHWRLNRVSQAFNARRPSVLTGGGERVDIDLTRRLRERRLDMYELSHLRRYQFAASQIAVDATVADLACGTGYGSALLAQRSASVVGADRDRAAVHAASTRYRGYANLRFRHLDLLRLDTAGAFDTIVSFETLEHFAEPDLLQLLRKFHRALKPRGGLIFSTPYLQEDDDAARALGFHQTFLIDEGKIDEFLSETGFQPANYYYQSYASHDVVQRLDRRDFVICVADKR